MRFFYVFSILFFFFLAGCVPYEQRPIEPRVTTMPLFEKEVFQRVGIYVRDNTRRIRQHGVLRRVEDEFARALIEKGYQLASRSDIYLLSKELDLQQSVATEESIAKKAKLHNIYAILFVDINKLESHYKRLSHPTPRYRGYYLCYAAISARLVKAESGRVVWMSSHEGRYRIEERTDGSDALPPVAQIVASGLP